MELFEEHYQMLKKYKSASNEYDKVLERKAKLYFSTQPKAVDTSTEKVDGGTKRNVFEEFVQKLETLDIDLGQARNERDLQKYLLKKKELEYEEYIKGLEINNIELDNIAVDNLIYYYTFIKHMKIKHIATKINYTREWTYTLFNKIKNKLQNITNDMLE